jgi:uncharacterized phage-associated protein
MTEESNNPKTEEITFEDAEFTAAHVANYFLWRAWEEDMEITPMKLQKLVYIAYGWNLVFRGSRLFKDPIVAWEYGPVIPSIYFEFKRYSGEPIKKDDYIAKFTEVGELDTVPIVEDDEVIKILDLEWNFYKKYSGVELSKITHKEGSAWSEAWGKGKNTKLDDAKIEARSKEKIELIVSEKSQ